MIHIEEMSKEQIDEVLRIYDYYIQEGKATFRSECQTKAEWDSAHCRDCRYVALDDDRVVGWVAVAHVSSRDNYWGVVEPSIYIDKDYCGKGIGNLLMQKICESTEEHGYWCLFSSIFSTNTASIAIHKKFGFREIGYRERIAKDRFGVWQNTTIMERRIK